MSYAGIQALLTGKKPYWLYKFTRGSEMWFYTSHASDVVTIPDVFESLNVFAHPDKFTRTWHKSSARHGKIPFSTDPGKSSLTTTFANSDIFARQFIVTGGVEATYLILYRGHLNDPDQELVIKYRGELFQVKPSDTEIALVFGADSILMDSKALVQVMQRPCPYAVYFGGCRLALADWQTDASATAATGSILTVAAAAGEADGTYTAGILEWGNFKEMIVGHSGAALTLARPIPGLADEITANGSAAIKLAFGCDLTLNTCTTRFSNNLNYAGFPWMNDTPFNGRSIV